MTSEYQSNRGGINGLGESLVNTNSREFRALQMAIQKLAGQQSEEDRLENAFLSIRFRMESWLRGVERGGEEERRSGEV